MSDISAKSVMDLRARTGLGVMECKKALAENNNDIDKAIEALRRSSAIKAAKSASRVAAEGMVRAVVNKAGDYGVVFEVNCETDFVARDEQFVAFVDEVAEQALAGQETSPEALMSGDLEEKRKNLVQKIGENIVLRRLAGLKGETLEVYNHGNNRVATLLSAKGANNEALHDVAMHVAAMNPRMLRPEDMPADLVEKEKALYIGQAEDMGKPKEMVQKIAEGKLQKSLKESSLLHQSFVKDPEKTVQQFLQDASCEVLAFVRYELGDGVEKKETDFAKEVAEQLGQ